MNIIILAASFAALTAGTTPSPMPVAVHGCLNNSRFLSHAAYTPDAPLPVKSCGHLLSTDRVITSHAWNHT